jgi:hypothetical protein
MADEAPNREVDVTTDLSRFVDVLHPGDVLLFDTLHPVSALIKFGENRPVNHAALYLGDGSFAEATAHPDKDRAAVQARSLGGRLASRRDRTVTAFRHVDATAYGGGTGVVARAQQYLEARDLAYSYLDLVSLVVPSFFRSYGAALGARGSRGVALAVALRRFLPALVSAMEADAADDDGGDGTAPYGRLPPTLTCSEFVFRCHQEATPSRRLEVTEPLASWSELWRAGRRRSDSGAEGVVLHRFLRAPGGSRGPSGGGHDEAFPGPGSGPELWQQLTRRAARTVLALVRRNLREVKNAQIVPSAVVAETVTPRDLWSSPSLAATAVFHRPPSDRDAGLDGIE